METQKGWVQRLEGRELKSMVVNQPGQLDWI